MLALSPYPKILCIWPNTSFPLKEDKCTIRQECLQCCFPSVCSQRWLQQMAAPLARGLRAVSLPRCSVVSCTA